MLVEAEEKQQHQSGNDGLKGQALACEFEASA
jgi:hypothetical protein